MPRLNVEPQGFLGRWLDCKFEPFMRWYSGFPKEAPQRTHRWNNHHLKAEELAHLDSLLMVARRTTAAPGILRRAGMLSHASRFVKGWRGCMVLAPVNHTGLWYVGWRWRGGGGVSRVPNRGPLRVTVGPDPCEWFGIIAEGPRTGEQVRIYIIGMSIIGDGGPFSQTPLY